MTWALLAAGAATAYALQGAWTKRLTGWTSTPVATWAIFGCSFPLLAAYALLRGLPEVETSFWWALAVNLAIHLVAFRMYVTALRDGDLGVTYPLLAVTPALVVPVEWLLLGDTPAIRGVLGIALVVAGVYLLQLRGDDRSPLAPLRALAGDPAARRMLGVAALWAITGTVDRVAVLGSSPSFYGAALSLGLGLGFLPAALRAGGEAPAAEGEGAREGGSSEDGGSSTTGAADAGGTASLGAALRRGPGALAIQGLIFAAMFVAQMEALRLALAAYVLAIKRSGTLLAVFIGGAWFEEEATGRRAAATVVLLAGVFLVATG